MLKVTPLKTYPTPRYPDKDAVKANPKLLMTACKAAQPQITAGTAPLFEHGSGHGSLGCSTVVLPIFLSEEEAYSIIIELAMAEEIHFNDLSITVDDTVLDRYDQHKKIGFEYISSGDVERLERLDPLHLVLNTPTLMSLNNYSKNSHHLRMI